MRLNPAHSQERSADGVIEARHVALPLFAGQGPPPNPNRDAQMSSQLNSARKIGLITARIRGVRPGSGTTDVTLGGLAAGVAEGAAEIFSSPPPLRQSLVPVLLRSCGRRRRPNWSP